MTTTASRIRTRAFQPTEFGSRCRVWLPADRLGLAAGAAVGSWTDYSGYGSHAVQGTGSLQPTYQPNVLNGRPVVRFDATDDWLATAAFASALAQPLTMFVVVRIAVAANYRQIVDGAAAGHRATMYRDNVNRWGFATSGAPLLGGTVDGGWHILGGLFAGAASALYVDTRPPVVAGDIGTETLTGLTVATDNTHVNLGMNGDIAEVILIGGWLSAPEMNRIGRYLSERYALPWRPI